MILRRVLAIVITFSFLFGVTNPSMKSTLAITNPSFAQSGKALPSSSFFTENKGQWDPSILFVGDTSFGKVAFTKDAVMYQMAKAIKVTADEVGDQFEKAPTTFETQLVKLSFVSPLVSAVQGDGLLSHYNNYFIGNDPSKWASYCRNFEKIEYKDVWEGIDLAYFFTPEGLKYEYYVDPQANIQDLQIKVEGAELATLGDSLEISTNLGNIQDANLKVFDQTTLREIPSRFQIQDNIISFTGIPEKRENTIVIDPLVWSTYLGGSGFDYANSIAVDAVGNVIIFGQTSSVDFPIRFGSIQLVNQSYWTTFIIKLNNTGTNVFFSTYLGGSSKDESNSITIDKHGSIYVCGASFSDDFPTTSGSYQSKQKNNGDAFISKINSTGTSLQYSTFLGGSKQDEGHGICVDQEGNAYIIGDTNSIDFLTTKNANQKKNKGDWDIFVVKLNQSGSKVVYSTYFGSLGTDYARGIAIDSAKNVYICGESNSTHIPISPLAFQQTKKGIVDAFVSKLSTSGEKIIFSTYLGGSGWDIPRGIAVDISSNIYVCGVTDSSDFPYTLQPIQGNNKGKRDIFVTKINPTGSSLVYSTLLGGQENDDVFGIAVDYRGNASVCGITGSSDFPTTQGAYQFAHTFKNREDAFISRINTIGSHLLYSTYFGGEGLDSANCIATDIAGNVYIGGKTESIDFPTTLNVYRNSMNSNKYDYYSSYDRLDAFVTKFNFNLNPGSSDSPSYQLIELLIDSQEAHVNNKPVILDQPPIIIKNRCLVPLRFLVEIFKSSVIYNPKEQGVQIVFGDVFISLWLNKIDASVEFDDLGSNNQIVRKTRIIRLDVAPFIRNGRTMVPVRFIAEAFGTLVVWDPIKFKVTITMR